MDDIIRVNDQFYVLATSPMVDDRSRVLKQGETFAVFDCYGDIQPVLLSEQGLYYEGTRFLSRLELSVGDDRPMLLSSTVKADNALFTVDLTNPDICRNGEVVIPRGTLHLLRTKFLWQGACYERLCISNYESVSIDVALSFLFEADFADIFEVRGRKRARKGQHLQETIEVESVHLAYEGLDGVIRRTHVKCSPRPQRISSSTVGFEISLQPKEEATFLLTVSCESAGRVSCAYSYDHAFLEAEYALKTAAANDCAIETSNEQFNEWLNRSQQDIHMMVTETPEGPYPYAGVPWFSTPFGRDGIITALEYLWVNPDIAKGVLSYLASTQAVEVIPEQDAEPGKILHESRKGEMATLGEIPFGRYYGSVDATPLFLLLAGAYYDRTGDHAFIEKIWPNIELALRWMDKFGDRDRDGFVEYARHSPNGLVHQGWKDSRGAVFHADGTPTEGPIALCEVQGYVYEAKCRAAQLACVLGQAETAQQLLRQAQALQERFEQAFWCEELSTYALALDGQKRQCKVRTSNAGHCLFTGIASQERARCIADSLLGKDFFSGWGIRTVAASEARFNPMSYHNGSVWPHDNALIAIGLARYGLKESVLKIMTGLFDASLLVDLHRLPELFCGFVRRPGESPTLYPVACAPQAWSAASVFMLLQACLGLTIHAHEMK
ncbi:MAG TPA: amylo-alpha-1,6-glucosidase, partial [Nitrospiraceae bacterium]|nr:amylo-alpha-1,6-glucosidase [Nitrospiraceae bacterium]